MTDTLHAFLRTSPKDETYFMSNTASGAHPASCPMGTGGPG
jgi:hypothetical protein